MLSKKDIDVLQMILKAGWESIIETDYTMLDNGAITITYNLDGWNDDIQNEILSLLQDLVALSKTDTQPYGYVDLYEYDFLNIYIVEEH